MYTVWSFASSSFGQPGNSSWDHNNIHLNNTPHNHGFQILLGITVFLREIENDGYTKFCMGVSKVHYGICEMVNEIILLLLLLLLLLFPCNSPRSIYQNLNVTPGSFANKIALFFSISSSRNSQKRLEHKENQTK